jgi:hypothetical protein
VSISVPEEPRAVRVEIADGEFVVHMEDGRAVHVPLESFPRLSEASTEDLADWRLADRQTSAHLDGLTNILLKFLTILGQLTDSARAAACYNQQSPFLVFGTR